MRGRHVSRDDGFTLIEMMTVVLIIGILIMVAVASFAVAIERSRRITCLQNQRTADSAIMQYEVDHAGAKPPDLAAIGSYVKWKGGGAVCSSDASLPLQYDPSHGDVWCTKHPR